MRTDPAHIASRARTIVVSRGAMDSGPFPGVPLIGCSPEAQATALRRLTILVVGCGSVGGRMALLLARLGVGALFLVDPKTFKAASVFTHEVDPADIGRAKAVVTGRRCKRVSPRTRVVAWFAPIESVELVQWLDVDLVVMSPDLMAVEVWVAQRCLWLGLPLLQASVHGASLTAQIRFFTDAKTREGGCPGCGYSQAEAEMLARQVRFSCEGAGQFSAAPPREAALATNSVSALCSLAANLALTQVLRYVLDLGQPVANTMLEYNGFTHRTVINSLRRKPDCRLDHQPLQRVVLPEPLPALSLFQLAECALGRAADASVNFEIPGYEWVERGACGCSEPVVLRRFVRTVHRRLPGCRACSQPVTPLSFHSYQVASSRLLGSAFRRPLSRLGVGRRDCVLVRLRDAGYLVHSSSVVAQARHAGPVDAYVLAGPVAREFSPMP